MDLPRWHPMVVHFPLALVASASLFLLAARRQRAGLAALARFPHGAACGDRGIVGDRLSRRPKRISLWDRSEWRPVGRALLRIVALRLLFTARSLSGESFGFTPGN